MSPDIKESHILNGQNKHILYLLNVTFLDMSARNISPYT